MKAVIYLRVSTSAQAKRDGEPEGYSIPYQRNECLRTITDRGWALAAEYVDAGESARSADRPQLKAMLERIAEGDIGAVVVHKIDRLARNIEDHVGIRAALRKHGTQLVSVTENIEETPSGRMSEGILAVMADFYSANLSAEIRKGILQKARSGGTPGKAPLGYLNVRRTTDGHEVRTIAVDPERAPLVRRAFELFATGEYTVDTLRRDLAAMGLKTRATPKQPAAPLSRSHLTKLLHSTTTWGSWSGEASSTRAATRR